MGRNTHDDWSDLDLWIVVADEHMDALGDERFQFIAQLVDPLFTVEAPQNAPAGGAYLLALYPGTQGPLMLDCSWQPRSSAQRPANTRLLFDRVSIPIVEPVTKTPGENSYERARHQTAFFWMMATVAGKYIARRRAWDAISTLSFLWAVTAEIAWLVGERTASPSYSDTPPFTLPTSPQEQLTALRDLTISVESLMGRIPYLHDAVSPDSIVQVNLYLDTVDASLSA